MTALLEDHLILEDFLLMILSKNLEDLLMSSGAHQINLGVLQVISEVPQVILEVTISEDHLVIF